jgi:hypothetical protein
MYVESHPDLSGMDRTFTIEYRSYITILPKNNTGKTGSPFALPQFRFIASGLSVKLPTDKKTFLLLWLRFVRNTFALDSPVEPIH